MILKFDQIFFVPILWTIKHKLKAFLYSQQSATLNYHINSETDYLFFNI